MKTFTDLEQSKKLSEFLSDKNADLYYFATDGRGVNYDEVPVVVDGPPEDTDVPCWSLAALLCVLPPTVRLVGASKDSYWYCECVSANNQEYAGFGSADNPVDACYEMIVKLNKHNLI